MKPDSETRAAAYREQQSRREAFRLNLEARLAGSESAAAAVRESWAPLTIALAPEGVTTSDRSEVIANWNGNVEGVDDLERRRRI